MKRRERADEQKEERVNGKMATYMAMETEKRKPIRLEPATENQEPPSSPLAGPKEGVRGLRKAPPRIRKPSRSDDRCFAPTMDLEKHRKSLREMLGDTMSDEFVEFFLGKLVEGLRPNPHDSLEEATVNAALAVIDSMHPQTEDQALVALKRVILFFSSQRFLRQSQHFLIKECLEVNGNLAVKLLRMEEETIRTYARLKHGSKQRIDVHRHVHIHAVDQSVLDINASATGEGNHAHWKDRKWRAAKVKPLAHEEVEALAAEPGTPASAQEQEALAVAVEKRHATGQVKPVEAEKPQAPLAKEETRAAAAQAEPVAEKQEVPRAAAAHAEPAPIAEENPPAVWEPDWMSIEAEEGGRDASVADGSDQT